MLFVTKQFAKPNFNPFKSLITHGVSIDYRVKASDIKTHYIKLQLLLIPEARRGVE